MEKILTNSQMRISDEYTINNKGISSQTLMRRAGEAIAQEVLSALKNSTDKKVLVVCGTGNNGGDGYVCARTLLNCGVNVSVYAFVGKLSEDCAREKQAYTGGYSQDIDGEIIVDCIFGTGLSREVTGEYARVIAQINDSKSFVISADIPSGINGDNGCIMGCAVQADLTVAIAEYKVGMFLGDGIDYCGTVIKKDIGITCPDGSCAYLTQNCDISAYYPPRRRNTHKGSYGSADIIAGSDKYIGAAALSVAAALKSGCGYVKLTTCESVKYAVAAKYPQAIYLDKPDLTSGAIAVGMGCGADRNLYDNIKNIIDGYDGTLIIDADGLNSLALYGLDILEDKRCSVILTPHIKEFSRLTGTAIKDILKNPVNIAREFAKKYGVILLLKGAASIITDGETVYINTRGSTALSKGGSGDMLAGYMCGCAARGLDPLDSALCAAYTLGLAAELSSEEFTDYCTTAKDILKNLPNAVKNLTT